MRTHKKSGRSDVLDAFDEVGPLLAVYNAPAKFVLREQWRDHALKGIWNGTRELHLSFDALLLYRVHEKDQAIVLVNVCTHEELEKL